MLYWRGYCEYWPLPVCFALTLLGEIIIIIIVIVIIFIIIFNFI